MKASQFRSSVRSLHLALSAVIGTYLYSPWSANAAFDGVVKWAIFPVLSLTGIALWQQAKILRLFGERRAAVEARLRTDPS